MVSFLKSFALIIFLNGLLVSSTMITHEFNDYSDHPCIRNCSLASTTPMECKYFFTIEWYKTLSKACYDCPTNKTDCSRPNCIAANGVERALISVNRMLPGPMIQVCENDVINVVVTNNLRMGESTTVHWHGLLQLGSPHMDGAGIITQCEIHAHSSFQYKFKAADPGTYFWHSHVAMQRADGFFGSLIIKPRTDVSSNEYDFDLNDHVIIFNDWFDETIVSKFAFHHHGTTDNNRATGILINGKGVDVRENATMHTPRAVFTVRQGFRYRFRLINSGVSFCPIQFVVDSHNFTVIATDGKPIEPVRFQSVTLHAGERYDVVINANKPIGNYWIKAKGIGDCEFNEVFQTAVLNYNTVPVDQIPFGGDDFDYDSIEINGTQLNNVDAPDNDTSGNYHLVNELKGIIEPQNEEYYKRIAGTPDKKFYYGMEFKKINNPEFNDPLLYPIQLVPYNKQYYTPQINKISFHMPDVPMLSQFDEIPKNMTCNSDNIDKVCPSSATNFCSCIHVVEVNLNDLVEFIFVDESATVFEFDAETIHPIHLHGHAYAIVSMDTPDDPSIPTTAEYIKQLDEEGKIERNFDKPPIKDTVVVPDSGYTIFRFIANNPGVWMVHCHLDFHMETGMGFVLKVGDSKKFPQAPGNWPRCGSYEYAEPFINGGKYLKNNYFLIYFMFFLTIIFNNFKKI